MNKWRKVKLGSLLSESRVESTNPDTNRRIRVKLNLAGVEKRPSTNDKKGATKYYKRTVGQFIYGKQNLHKGAFGVVPQELDGFESSSDIPAFDVHESCYANWIFYFFKQGDFYLTLESLAKGVGSKRIQPKKLFELKIPLPSKEEQKKVLDQIAEFETNCKILETEISSQVELVNKLRESILRIAFEGKLTENWRKEAPNQEHAKELLERIEKERAQLILEKKIRKPSPLSPIEQSEITHEIPEGWVWCKLGKYAYCERGRFSARPRNDPKFYNGIYPFIQIRDLSNNGGLISNHNQTLNESGLKVSKMFPKGTVVIAIVGATIGNTGILAYDMCFPDSLVGIKPSNNICIEYLEYYLRFKKSFFRDVSYAGGGQPNIKLPTINESILPLPPLSEQRMIAERIQDLMEQSKELLTIIHDSSRDLELLMKVFLSESFGEENILPLQTANDTNQQAEESIIDRLSELKISNAKDNMIDMELVELLKENKRLSALNLWKMSTYQDNIDAFYAALKIEIEDKKTIKESEEKGFLELVI